MDALLGRHRVAVRNGRDELRLAEKIRVTIRVFAKENYAISGIVARSPQIIIIVSANRLRQSQRRAIIVNRARLAIVSRQDRATSLLRVRKRVINAGNRLGHIIPTKHIRIKLRQRDGRISLHLHRARVRKYLRIADKTIHRQQRDAEGQRNNSGDHDERAISPCNPSPPLCTKKPSLQRDASSGYQNRIYWQGVISLPV